MGLFDVSVYFALPQQLAVVATQGKYALYLP
jgi:hypothetical protein